METAPTEDALLGGRIRLLQPPRGYRVAVDAVLLAAAVDAAPGDRVLDLGAGVGAVGLCLAARVPGCTIVGIELQPGWRPSPCAMPSSTAPSAGCGRSSTTSPSPCRPTSRVSTTSPPTRPICGRRRRSVAEHEQGPGHRRIERRPRALACGGDGRPETGRHLDRHSSQRPSGGDRGPSRAAGLRRRHGEALPPAARILLRARGSSAPARRASPPLVLHRRKAATPTRPRRSCVTPLRLPSSARAATVPAMLNWIKDRFRRGPVRAGRPAVRRHRLGAACSGPRPVHRRRWRRCSSAPSTCAAPRPWPWRSTRPAARRCSRP